MRAFEIHPPKNPATVPATPRRRRRRRWLLAGLFLLVLGGLGWALRPDPRLARARELQKDLFANRPAGPLTEEQKARVREFRAEVARLSEGQKRALFEPMRQKAKEELRRYSGLSPREKTAYLDRIIDRSLARQKAAAQPRPGGPAGPGFGPPGAGQGGSGPPGTGQGADRRKQMLDNTTPEDRAARDQLRHDLNARQRQRGLTAGGGGFGR